MIVLLGSTGYIGQAFGRYLSQKRIPWKAVTRKEIDICNPRQLGEYLRYAQADFLINCAGYTGKPNVDACEDFKADCLLGNAVLPGRIREACDLANIPWGHVSSGCIYTGSHADGSGFTEVDPPNFSFRANHCSFYSGAKALGEEILADCGNCYIWRLRIPFNEIDSPRNYLSKLMTYAKLLDATNSLSQLDEFVSAAVACWTKRCNFGIYNVVNTGSITTREIVAMLRQYQPSRQDYTFFESEADFMARVARTPRSNCILDNSILRRAGIAMRPIHEAVEDAIRNWKSA